MAACVEYGSWEVVSEPVADHWFLLAWFSLFGMLGLCSVSSICVACTRIVTDVAFWESWIEVSDVVSCVVACVMSVVHTEFSALAYEVYVLDWRTVRILCLFLLVGIVLVLLWSLREVLVTWRKRVILNSLRRRVGRRRWRLLILKMRMLRVVPLFSRARSRMLCLNVLLRLIVRWLVLLLRLRLWFRLLWTRVGLLVKLLIAVVILSGQLV